MVTRTRVAEFDLARPRPVWGLTGYSGARVLVRDNGQPVGWIHLTADGYSDALDTPALQQAALRSELGAADDLALTSSTPPISVVVCTRDRHVALRGCLQSLHEINYSNFEVIVVDNASRGTETRSAVQATGFRYVREDRPGLDNARNCGAAAAVHDILAYTDDDVRVDAGWLRGIALGFTDPDIACVTGLICPLELETPAQHMFESYGGMGKGFKSRLFNPSLMSPENLITSHVIGVGANMAYRRSVLLDLGGFDPNLDVGTPSGGAGDLDMFHRVLSHGYKIRYQPRAMVWHQHRRSLPGLYRQIYNNGRSFGCYLLKVAAAGTVQPRRVAAFAARQWIGGWLIGSMLDRSPGRSLPIIAAETWGALHAPAVYLRTFGKVPWSRRRY